VKKLRSPNQLILKIKNIDIFFNIVKKLRFPNLKKINNIDFYLFFNSEKVEIPLASWEEKTI
jgi:hypothetical protein